MNHLLNVTVGNGLYEMHLNDFDDILLTREIDIWSVPPEKIVDVIIRQIDENKYVMIDLYVRKQFPDGGGNDIQSWLIYGYDKTAGVLYYLCMINKQFTEDTTSFDFFTQVYADMQEVYEGDAKTKVLRRMSYYPLGTIELKEYSEDNAVFHSLIYKIQPEYSGGVFREIHLNAEGKEISNQTWYKGID